MRIVMNGVTGRMGSTQHLLRSIMAIRADGGLKLPGGGSVMPEPVLVGRNKEKLRDLAGPLGLEWSTDLRGCLEDQPSSIYFDAQTTAQRAEAVELAMSMGLAVYCEKPVAAGLEEALRLAAIAKRQGICNGVVQDKLFLPGLVKLSDVIRSGVLGEVLAVRGEFGYWVFDGRWRPSQRPTWNYRVEEGGGIISDMFPHWRYVLEALFGPVRAVTCTGATHMAERYLPDGERYACTAEDSAYATFELEGGIIAQFNSSWTTRVYRDDLLQIQVDGTNGSAVCGLHNCRLQDRALTPMARWDPDVAGSLDYRSSWAEVPVTVETPNAFRAQWERFILHVAIGAPFPWDFLEGAKGVQLAELAEQSRRERRWVDVPEISL